MSVVMKPLNVRFDVESVNSAVERIREKTNESKSEIIREALDFGLELIALKNDATPSDQ